MAGSIVILNLKFTLVGHILVLICQLILKLFFERQLSNLYLDVEMVEAHTNYSEFSYETIKLSLNILYDNITTKYRVLLRIIEIFLDNRFSYI